MQPFQIPSELLTAIKDNKLIVFIGSGYSTDFKLPDWKSLLLDIAKAYFDSDNSNEYKDFETYLEKNKDSLDFIETLERFSFKKDQIKSRVLNQFFLKRLAIDPILETKHKYLFNITKKIITTNYDNSVDFLADDFGINKIVWDSTLNLQGLNSDSEFYFKLHGDVEDFSSCIVFKDDYEKLYSGDHPAVFQLKKLITENVCLFIGYSFRDRDIREAYSYIHSLFQGSEKTNYIITVNEVDRNELEKKYNLNTIKLDSYTEIADYIKELARLTNKDVVNKKMLIEAYDYDCIGRVEEKQKIADFIKNPAKSFLFLYGPGGIGKTHLIYDVIANQANLQNWNYFKITEGSTVTDLIAVVNKRVANDTNTLANLIKYIEYQSSSIFIDDFYEIKEDEKLASLILNLANSQRGKIIVLSRSLPKDIVVNRQSHEPIKIGLLDENIFLEVIKQTYALRKGNYPLFELTDDLAKKIGDKCQGYPLPILFIFDKLNEPEINKDDILEKIPQFSQDLNNDEIITRLISSVIVKERKKEIRLLRDLSSIIGTISPDILSFLSSYESSLFISLYNKGFIWKKDNYFFIHPFIKEVLVKLLGSSRINNADIGKYYESLIQTSDFYREEKNILNAILYYKNSRSESGKEFKKRMFKEFNQKEINTLYDKIFEKNNIRKISGTKQNKFNYTIEFARNVLYSGYKESLTDLIKAKELLIEQMSKKTNLFEIYLLLGNVCRKIGKSRPSELFHAKKYLEEARLIAPFNIEVLGILAIVYRELKEFEKSIEYSNLSLELDPNDVISRNVLGITYKKMGAIDDAISSFEAILSIEPKNLHTLNELAQIFRKIKPNLPLALFYYDKIIEYEPSDVHGYNGRGMAYFEFNDIPNAILNLQKAIDIYPSHLHSITELGRIFRLQKRFEEAIAVLKKGLEVDENDPPTLEQLGYTYMDMKKFDEAESYLKTLQKSTKSSNKSAFSFGLLYSNWGKYQKVIDYLEPLNKIGDLRRNQIDILKEAYFKLGRKWPLR